MESVGRRMSPIVEWGFATRALGEYEESGDLCLVKPFPNGVLVAAIDGLGHGPKAAEASKAALGVLTSHAQKPPDLLLKLCHEELKRTRGAVISLASFNALAGTVTWVGVGNVKGLLLSSNGRGGVEREWLLLRGGVVGYNLPNLYPAVLPVRAGDMLIFATDGLRSIFAEELTLGEPPQQMADRILAGYFRGTDDALVVVVRYLGLEKP
ncbi:MAG: SpoIIE family protein phosphatase [Anaerolineae bacterium]|nr:SpoIIE family protein phosphatase [Anaerolineae bacterium]